MTQKIILLISCFVFLGCESSEEKECSNEGSGTTSNGSGSSLSTSSAPLRIPDFNIANGNSYSSQDDISISFSFENNDDKSLYTFSCYHDSVKDLNVADTNDCTTLPGTASFDAENGILTWQAGTAGIGAYEIKISSINANGSTTQAQIFDVVVTPPLDRTNGLAHFDARLTSADGFTESSDSVLANLVSGPFSFAMETSDESYLTDVDSERVLSFNGTDSYLKTPPMKYGDNFTIDMWVRFDVLGTQILVAKRPHSGVQSVQIFESAGVLYARVYSGFDIFIGRQTPASLTAGEWYHLTFSYDGSADSSGVRIFIDGVQADNANSEMGVFTTFADLDVATTVGVQNVAQSGSAFLDGSIANFRISKGAVLTNEEARALCNEHAVAGKTCS